MNNKYNFTAAQITELRTDLYAAYYDCRRRKRSTHNALRFELNFEEGINKLHELLLTNTYLPGKSIAFIVTHPVKREVFAADFRDRIIHHYIIGKLNPIFEKLLIYDSYGCRKGKGAFLGAERVTKFIRACSGNYKKDAYILKLDVQGFFMNIDKKILHEKLRYIIDRYYTGYDKELIYDLCTVTLEYNPVENCILKGDISEWDDVPVNKSLLKKNEDSGVPIGNLTSQMFANVYLNDFDHFIKRELKLKYYSRYVDDFVIIHEDKEYLKSLIPVLKEYLTDNLNVTLHPKKIHLQHYTKGVQFVGVFIKPYRRYIGRRTGNHMKVVFSKDYEALFKEPNSEEKEKKIQHWLSSANSLLGISKHYNTYKLRKKVVEWHLSPYSLFKVNEDYSIVTRRTIDDVEEAKGETLNVTAEEAASYWLLVK